MKNYLPWIFVIMLLVACSPSVQATSVLPVSTSTTQAEIATVTPQVVVRDTPVVFSAPVVTMSVTEMVLGDLGTDVWGCRKVSSDGKKCLDNKKNSPVFHIINSIYGEPNLDIHIQSRDLDQGEGLGNLTLSHEKKFEVKVEDTTLVADYGQCIVSSVGFEVIKDFTSGVRTESNVVFTVCFDGTTWYASIPQ